MVARHVSDLHMSMTKFRIRIERKTLSFGEIAGTTYDLEVAKSVFAQAGDRDDMIDLGASELLRSLPHGFIWIPRRNGTGLGYEGESANRAFRRYVSGDKVWA